MISYIISIRNHRLVYNNYDVTIHPTHGAQIIHESTVNDPKIIEKWRENNRESIEKQERIEKQFENNREGMEKRENIEIMLGNNLESIEKWEIIE